MKEVIDSLSIDQRQIDIYRFIYQKKYLFPDKKYNYIRLVGDLLKYLHSYRAADKLVKELVR